MLMNMLQTQHENFAFGSSISNQDTFAPPSSGYKEVR